MDAGDPICVVETTKTAYEVTTGKAGYVRQLSVSVGIMANAEELICVITDSQDEPVEEPLPKAMGTRSRQRPAPEGVRTTKRAAALAAELGIDLSQISHKGIVTEDTVRSLAGLHAVSRDMSNEGPLDMRLIIYGGGGHAKKVIDLVRQIHSFRIVGIIDDGLTPSTTVLGVPVVRPKSALPKLVKDGVRLAANAVAGIADMSGRVQISDMLARSGFAFPVLRHPSSVVEPSAVIEDGVQIFANTFIGSAATIKKGAIINTGAIVSHDCVIGEYSHVAPGSVLAGAVQVGPRTLIGMGVLTAIGIKIGSDVRIGNGALIHQDVPDRTIVRSGSTWPSTK